MVENRLRSYIRDVPDWPKEGVIFKDITTLLRDPEALRLAVDALADRYRDRGIDYVASVEARGFILGGPVAYLLGAGFVPIRKPGKLPWETRRAEYELEYGTDAVEVHVDAFEAGSRVLVCDDLLATGGTALATARLVEACGAAVEAFVFLVELDFLSGRDKLDGYEVFSIIHYG
ncbi:MAG: adenine phosphoribosyltransferase [candidate division Zixibacteria bacterium]|nr:adenine phosphoribosyltransferase [candidate division Zixibacteria bacterium]